MLKKENKWKKGKWVGDSLKNRGSIEKRVKRAREKCKEYKGEY